MTLAAVTAHAVQNGAPPAPKQLPIGSVWHPSAGSQLAGAGTQPGTHVTSDGLVIQNGYVVGYHGQVNPAPDTQFPIQPYHPNAPLNQPPGVPVIPNQSIVDTYRGPSPIAPDTGAGLLKGGFDNPTPGTTGPDNSAGQAAIDALIKSFNSMNGKSFQVQPDQLSANLIGNPFGKNGYQPPSKLENSILQGINGDMSNNYLGAFLPEAIKLVSQEYGPAVAAALFQGQQGANTIQGYNTGAAELLQGIAGKVGQTYDNSIGLQAKLDQGIRKSLAGQNPNNSGLLPFGAPQAQADQINQQNNTSFNGAGAVLGGLGDLNASSLAAQKAAAVSAAMQMPGLNAFSGRQALAANSIGTQQALAKIQTQEGKDALKIAGTDLAANGRDITAKTSLYRTLTSNDAKYISDQLGIEKANQSTLTRVHITNAANRLSAIRASISAENAAVNQQRYALALVKAKYPTLSPAGANAAAKTAQSFFTNAVHGQLHTVHNPDGTTTTNVMGQLSYDDAVRQWATTHGGDVGQAQAYAAGFYNYGQAGRPFDLDMQRQLQKAGQPTVIFTDTSGQHYVSQQQLAVLAKGHGSLVQSIVKANGQAQLIPADQALQEGLITAQEAATGKPVNVWIIPQYGK